MLADSPYRHELEADVEPFRSILLGLFFLAVGMMLDLHTIAERPFFVIGMAIGLVAIKTLVIFGIGKMFGMKWRAAWPWACCSARAANSALSCLPRPSTPC
jgi:CPA2 family monovalent cation:H+ antiporter-2/glutathione-regulated potassium-efflux system protein KefB